MRHWVALMTALAGCGAHDGAPLRDPSPPPESHASQPPVAPIEPNEPTPNDAVDEASTDRAAVPQEARNLTSGNAAFAVDLYARLAARSPNDNIVFSPASIRCALAMTWAAAGGATASEMASTLHFEGDADAVHRGFGWSLRHWNRSTARPYTLTVANRLFVDVTREPTPAFLALTSEHYLAGVERMNVVLDSEAARAAINGWVDRTTEHHIPEIVPPGAIDPSTPLVLVNAVYFEGQWETPFDPADTRPATFHAEGRRAISVPTMSVHTSVRFGHHADGLSIVELPYEGDELALILLVPDRRDGLADVERQLSSIKLAHWLGMASGYTEVDLTLPRFKLEPAAIGLSDELAAMGMPSAFDPDRAELHFNQNAREHPHLRQVLHRAMIEVDEQGTVAAAATAVMAGTGAAPPQPTQLHVDHPFLFALRDRVTGALLFFGRVVDPRES